MSGVRARWWLRWGAALLVALSALMVAHWLDRRALHTLYEPELRRNDWYQILRAAGDLRTWAVVGLAMMLAGQVRRGLSAGLAAAAAGLIAEALKLIIGRERPVSGSAIQNAGGYVWKDGLFDAVPGFLGGFSDSSNLGIPSSHTAVAFAGCVAIGARWPRTLIVLLPLAAGCGVGRMLTGAHFLSDVLAGAVVGGVIGLIASGRLRRSARAGKSTA